MNPNCLHCNSQGTPGGCPRCGTGSSVCPFCGNHGAAGGCGTCGRRS